MTHVVKDYTNLIGAPWPQVDAALRSTGAGFESVGTQKNGSWLLPGSLTQYGDVPDGEVGVVYYLEGRDVYIKMTYTRSTQKVTRAVQFAVAKNWVQRIGGIAELAAGKILDFYTAGASSQYTKGLENKGKGAAVYQSNNGVVGILDPTNSVPAVGAGSTSTQDQLAGAVLAPVVGSLTQPASSASNATGHQSTPHPPSILILGALLIAVALTLKAA